MSKLMEGAPCNIVNRITGQSISIGCSFINEEGHRDGIYYEAPIEFEDSGHARAFQKSIEAGLHTKIMEFLQEIVEDNSSMTEENMMEMLKYMFVSHERGVEMSTEEGKTLFRPINRIEGATSFSTRDGEDMTIWMTDNDIYGWYISHDVAHLQEARNELGGGCDLDKFVSLVKPYSDFYLQKYDKERDKQ